MRSSGAHCDRTLAVEAQLCTLRSGGGEDDWGDTWRRGLARSLAKRIGEEDWLRGLAKRIGETLGEILGEEDWRGGGGGEGEEGGGVVLIKFSNPHLAGGKNRDILHK